MPCKKCRNPVLPPPISVGAGNTSQPCPICGYQNYNFGEAFQKNDGGTPRYEHTCKRCRDEFYTDHPSRRDYCTPCLHVVRGELSTARNAKKRAEGGKLMFGAI